MDESELEALLGRPLTPTENTNFDLYLDIAKKSLEELLCISLDSVSETRTFDVRDGYSTVFTGIFTSVSELKVDGVATTDYHPAFWDKRSNPYYNSVVLGKSGKTVEITATWGFDTVPNDLKLLWAQAFANVSKKYVPGGDNIKSKQIEDFRVSYGDLTDDEAFINANKRTIAKYSMCNIGYVMHGGGTCKTHGVRRCGYCI